MILLFLLALAGRATCRPLNLPLISSKRSQIVYFDRKLHNILPADFHGRNQFSPYPELERDQLPAIVVFDARFEEILGPEPSLVSIAISGTPGVFPFHEAPIWVEENNEIFISSDANALTGHDQSLTYISKFSLDDLSPEGKVNVTRLNLDLINANGGTNFDGKLLYCTEGRHGIAGEVALVDTRPPYQKKTLLNNFYGRQFNSPNDIEVHPQSKAIFFTDPLYGWYQAFRPPPQLPVQVYRFDPNNGRVTVVAEGFVACNGLVFSPDGKKAYVTDTGVARGNGNVFFDPSSPATIYEFDVLSVPLGQRFINRRVFAYVDTGAAGRFQTSQAFNDGIKVDTRGNVYASAGDGVHVFASDGVLLGKFLLGKTSSNLVFAGFGRLIILANDEIFLAGLSAQGTLPNA
ncbi:calcium-dependent phosphotriesterase [Atractiella rhizophila]|nr:calcium-dependent phosphotriesterase [Atractiella rhizophila]